MKRMLREFFRVRQARISPVRDILVIPKSAAKELSFAQIVKELEKILPLAQDTD
jgi:ribonuclease P protein component